MVNVVVDTNVLMASLIVPAGPNRRALRRVLDPATPLRICYSSRDGGMSTMTFSIAFPSHPAASSNLPKPYSSSCSMSGEERWCLSCVPAIVYPDEKDRPFLEAAIYVNGVLLTNNLKDYPFLGVTVIGPEEFLDWCDEMGAG